MKRIIVNRQRGFTLTELLVVMVIIGLLATIAIPVYVARTEDARVRIAYGEARELAHAEEQCAIFHGFYVPFQVLDDLPGSSSSSTNFERIDTEPPSQVALIDPLTPANQQRTNGQPTLASTNPRAKDLIKDWHGPFMNFQRYYFGDGTVKPGTPQYFTSPFLFLDFPLDPWGSPYRFYSSVGVIGTSAHLAFNPSSNNTQFGNGLITNNDDRFDRYTVVSFARDGISDNDSSANPNNPNDIVYTFGTDGVESNFGRIW